jgi:RES domain-containing protein
MIGFRVSSYDTPCPPSPSRRDGRWARAGDTIANYWSLHPHGAWSELYRYHGWKSGDTVLESVAERVWVGRFNHLEPFRISDENAGDFGLTADSLIGDDWEPCQRAARRLIDQGYTEIIVPSAALPGTDNLVLFGQRLAIPWLDAPDAVDIPSAVVAELTVGVPLVAAATRHRGDAGSSTGYQQRLPTPLPR